MRTLQVGSRSVLGTVVVALLAQITLTASPFLPQPAYAGPPANASIELSKTVEEMDFVPTLDLSLTVDKAHALPSELLTYVATVTHSGATLTIFGQLTAVNTSEQVATVAYFDDMVEYRSQSEKDWLPVAGTAAGLPGYEPLVPAPYTEGMVLVAEGIPAGGVTYPASEDGIVGTLIGPGATATWQYAAALTLTPEQVLTLLDPQETKALRNAVHFEITPRREQNGQPYKDRVSFTELLEGVTAEITDATVTITRPDGSEALFTPATTPELSVLTPGESVAVETTYTVPASTGRSPGESDETYLSRLLAEDGRTLAASAEAQGLYEGETVEAPSQEVSTLLYLPVLTVDKEGPPEVEPATTAAYTISLQNLGSAGAESLLLSDVLPDGVTGTVGDPPAVLAPGEGAVVEALIDVPAAQPAGNLTDTAVLNWFDGNGNFYGDVSDSFTTVVVPVNEDDLPDLIVTLVDTSETVVDGQTLEISGNVSAEIANQGVLPAAGFFTLFFFEDRNGNGTYEEGLDNLLGSAAYSDLASGETARLTAPVTGTVLFADNLIYAFVDSLNTVRERDETNNYNNNGTVCSVPEPGEFAPTLEWQWTGSSTLSSYRQVMMTPAVVDLTNDGIPDIVFSTFSGSNYNTNGHLRAIHGDGSGEIFTVTSSSYDVRGAGSVAVGDIDLDGRPEILAVDESGSRLIAFEHDGTFKWRSPNVAGGIGWGGAALADLEGDGVPEIVVGATVLNNDGSIRWQGSYGRGINGPGPLSLVADLDMSGTPEVVAGNTAYRADGSLYWNVGLADGFNAVANFDEDPFPEVVLVTNGKVYLLEHDGTLKWGPSSVPGGGRVGAPTVADVDGDGEPEIGVAGGSRYAVFETDGTLKWSSATRDRSSNVTGSSVFDFEGDGSAEIVYSDELRLRIYRGTDGTILWSIPSPSGTTFELPLIVDVDADGNAEIVMISNNYAFSGSTGVQVYGDSNDNWVATRRIWNQHTYHITNVNDDGTVPVAEINNWEVYNNYRQNVFTEGPCASAQPDLTASYARRQANPDGSTTVTVRIGNGGGIFAPSGVFVAFYDGDPRSGGTLLGTARTSDRIYPGSFEDVDFTIPAGVTALPLWAVADDIGGLNGAHSEPDEVNNLYNTLLYLTLTPNQPPVVDAGGDQEITLPNDMTVLAGTAADDGLPIGQLTVVWGLVSAPETGEASIDTPSALSTLVHFTTAGEYVFRLSASDVDLEAADEVTVTVHPDPTQPPPPPPAPPDAQLQVPGFITSPDNGETYDGSVSIVVAPGTQLTDVTLDYWPVDDRRAVTVLDSGFDTSGGQVGEFDTTTLANGSYVLRVHGDDPSGGRVASAVLVVVEGEYKPGRVRFTINDLTIPVTGLPITVERTYDSLNRRRIGDFGYGWELSLASPRVEVNPANDVTLTMPDGDRVTFYFTPYAPSPIFGFLFLPRYTPQAGVYGSLESNGCSLITISGGQTVCFPGGLYADTVSRFTYTDPRGRVFDLEATGKLRSITDLDGNHLSFTAAGIVSSSGNLTVAFDRDAEGRITRITDPLGHTYDYGYDAVGDLSSVSLPDVTAPVQYSYDGDHFFLEGTDPRGNATLVNTYYPDGRLESATNAVGDTTSFAYDLTSRTTTTSNPDGGQELTTFDSQGLVIHRVDELGAATTMSYDGNHNLTVRVDPLGNATTYSYDSKGFSTSTTNPLGHTVAMSNNRYGGLLSLTDPLGNAVAVTQDAEFHPLSFTDSLGPLGASTWSSRGSQLSQTNGAGEVTSYTYDAYGNRTSETDPLGNATTYTYDTLGRVLSQTDPRGHTTEMSYDALGRVLSITEPLGLVTTYEYDANGNRITETVPTGESTSYGYDAANRLISVTYPDATTESFAYDWRDNIVEHTDQAGRMTVRQYDLRGLLVSETLAAGTAAQQTTTFTYDAAGRRIRETDDLGNATHFAYDDASRLVRTTDALGNLTTYTFDAGGRLTAVTDAKGRQETYAHDARGHVTRITYADGTFTQRAYDGVGRLVSMTDPVGNVTAYTYDAAGRLLAVTDPLGQTTHYTYDAAGNLLTIVDANGRETGLTYDALNRVTQKTWPDGRFETFTYGADENVLSHRLADGEVNHFVYDVVGRLIQEIYADGQTVAYTYTPTGQRETVTDARGVTSYTYDPRDRLTRVTVPEGASVNYTYDAVGNRLSMTTPAGTTAYGYDPLRRLTQVTDPWGAATTYVYDAVGTRTEAHLPNGVTTEYTYDARDRLTAVRQVDGATTLASFAYTLDAAGNRLNVIEADGSGSEWLYDGAYRLVGEIRRDSLGAILSQTAYTYDAVGNRLSQTTDGVTTVYQYDALDQLVTAGSVQYQYDGRGSLAQVVDGSDVTLFTYDAADRLRTLSLPGGENVSYAYDAADRRVTQNLDSQVTRYLWDETSQDGDVVLETDGAGTALASYVLGDGELISQDRGGLLTYYLFDGQGSVSSLADALGTLTDSYRYDAFGGERFRQGTTVNPYRYTGQQLDEVSGLYYLRARYYDPASGRFLSRDPAPYDLRDPAEVNRYLYARANPVNFDDPSGLAAESVLPFPGTTAGRRVGGNEYALLVSFIRSIAKPAVLALGATVACQFEKVTSELLAVAKAGSVLLAIEAIHPSPNPCHLSIFVYPGVILQQIGNHIQDAQDSIYPMRLTYLPAGSQRDAKRRAACPANDPRRNYPQNVGKSCDEYPFAMSHEAPASTRYVPVAEQNSQGGFHGAFVRRNRLRDRDPFAVVVVPQMSGYRFP